jgi:hypothetical protein
VIVMLRNWKWPYWRRRSRSGTAVAEEGAMEIPALGPAAALASWETAGLLDTRREPQPRLHLEVDEGVSVAVALNESPAAILDATQRLRECRERERSAVPPVYNFGGESSWSGYGD